MNRREFLTSATALMFASGCKCVPFARRPNLVFGVVSDIHITTEESCADFRKALKYFKRRGVDAVMSPGDLTDWGTKNSLIYLKRTWDEVFGGTKVVPLFCTGNHDFEGFHYGDMALEMRANGVSDNEALVKNGIKAMWREIMGEEFEPIGVKTVKGYDFVSLEWNQDGKLKPWMEENASRFTGDKPFFFFQHYPIKGTTSDSRAGTNAKEVLSNYKNCVAFTGHTHQVFHYEKLFWRGEFTAISTPSLSYASLPGGENALSRSKDALKWSMQPIPSRRDLRGDQGFLVNVFDDEIIIERIDLEEEASDCAPWVVPLSEEAKCSTPKFEMHLVGPEFPEGAFIVTQTRNTENRAGEWTIVMNLEFPSPVTDDRCRVHYYEVRAYPVDGSECEMVKKFVSPAYHRMRKYEPKTQRFWFDVRDLPQGKEYYLEARARCTFGVLSAPIRSKKLFMLPDPRDKQS